MKKSDTIDHQGLDPEDVIGKKIIDIHLNEDPDGDTLELMLDDGKQIEIYLHNNFVLHVESD